MVGLSMAVVLPAGAASRDRVSNSPGFDLGARVVASPPGLVAGEQAPTRLSSCSAVTLLDVDPVSVVGRVPEGLRVFLDVEADGARDKAKVEKAGPRGLVKMMDTEVSELPGDNLVDNATTSARSRTRQTRDEN